MSFDFSSLIDRHGRDAIAIDGLGSGGAAPHSPDPGFDAIPMWVADMNFATAPSVIDALRARIDHPCFGYFRPTEEYFDRIIGWHASRNGVAGLRADHIGYENGLLGGLVSTLSCFASPGDFVLLHSPTYIGFTKSIENAGFRIALSPLVLDDEGVYRMDLDDMDRVLTEHNIHVAVFCSPHNPTGRVWEAEELEQAMEVYRKHDCIVISDEIWSDIILPGYRHIPLQSVSEDARMRTVALYAPSKSFNLAGLIGSYHIIYNEYLRDRVSAQGAKSHYNDMNVLSMHALIGAYGDEGSTWVDELLQVLGGNVELAYSHIVQNYPGIRISRPQGTYMLFLDCSEWCAAHRCDVGELLSRGWRVGVGWQDGRPFHGPAHIRMNLASPRSQIEKALQRLDDYVFSEK